MYHPGKVIEIIKSDGKDVVSADSTTQATLDMWDENVITMEVADKLASKLKVGNMVLVDYRPSKEHEAPVPAHMIVSIISGKKAKKIWDAYSEMLAKKKQKTAPVQPPAQSYIG